MWTTVRILHTKSVRTCRNLLSAVDAELPEARTPATAKLVSRHAIERADRGAERLSEQARGRVVVDLGATFRLGHDGVDHAELEAVDRVGPERRGGLLRLAGVAPENRRAALGRDDGVDRVLLHE